MKNILYIILFLSQYAYGQGFQADSLKVGAPQLASSPYYPLYLDNASGKIVYLTSPDWTGWANYVDNGYTEGAPFTLAQGVTDTLMNHADSIISAQTPLDVTNFYNAATQSLIGENIGDGYLLRISFAAKNTNNNGWFSVSLDLGGGLITAKDSRIFYKLQNTEQLFNIVIPYYTLNTFIANGARVMITAEEGDMEIYNIGYLIFRTHKAR